MSWYSLLTSCRCELKVHSGGSGVMLSLQFCLSICPVETAVGFILEEFPAVVFPLSSHTHVLGQGWVLHPISSCPLCGRAGRTKGSVVCPLSLKRGAVVPSSRDSGLYWCDKGHFLSPQSLGWSTVLDSLFTQLTHGLVGRKKDDVHHQRWGVTFSTLFSCWHQCQRACALYSLLPHGLCVLGLTCRHRALLGI